MVKGNGSFLISVSKRLGGYLGIVIRGTSDVGADHWGVSWTVPAGLAGERHVLE